MKRSGFLVPVLLALCFVNAYFLLPAAVQAVRSGFRMGGLNNHQRRAAIWGPFYLEMLKLKVAVPEDQSLRLVSNKYPWYLAYYAYPRRLRLASSQMADLNAVRQRYPKEWVLAFEDRNGRPVLEALSPLIGTLKE